MLGRDGGVAIDQLGHHAAQRLDAERQRRHVEQQHVLHVALQHARLDGGANGDHFVGVDALVGLAAEQLPHGLLHLRHAGLAADEHDLVDLGGLRPASFNAALQGSIVLRMRSSTSASSLARSSLTLRCFGPFWSAVMKGRLTSVCVRARELDLGLLGRVLEALQRETVLAQIDAVLLAGTHRRGSP